MLPIVRLQDRLFFSADCNMTVLFVIRTDDKANLTIDFLSVQPRAGLHEIIKSRRMP
jgi:hypothetical protein